MNTIDTFWARVEKTDTCWFYTGKLHPTGYGYIDISNKRYLVHRLSYTLIIGEIPAGLHLDHLCRVTNCVNPKHLEPVTNAENVKRMYLYKELSTHCIHGHEYLPENIYFHKRYNKQRSKFYTQRLCRQCIRTNNRKHKNSRQA